VAPTERVILSAAEIPQALALSDEAGWNQSAEDWAVFVRHGKVLGLLAQGRLAATAAVLPYGEAFGWISMVLVTAGCRRRGYARELMTACIARLRETGRVAFLDATPAGAAVYAAFGFRALCGMQRWAGNGTGRATPSRAEVADIDAPAFGADRRFLLDSFLGRPGSAAYAADGGCVLLRPGRHAMQIGPLVADTTSAPMLLDSAIAAAHGPVVIDLLESGAALEPWLEARGFTPQRRFLRMALGAASMPGDPARLLVAAGPEFG